MQRVTLVRYTAKPDRAAENEALSLAVFKELKAKAPAHVTYALFKNGLDFVHLFVNTKDDDASVLVELDSFKAYSKEVGERTTAPPEIMRLDCALLEGYGLPT